MSEQGPSKDEPTQGARSHGKPAGMEPEPAKPSVSAPDVEGVVWVRFAPSQVARTIAIALLTAMVVLGALYLLWQIHTLIGWCVLALLLAAVLNPAVNWLQRHRIKRSLSILLTYLGLVAVLVGIVGIFVPLLVNELRDLINFVVTGFQDPRGLTEYFRDILDQFRLGWLVDTLSNQLADVPSQLGAWAKSLLLSAGVLAVSAAGFVTALVSILTLAFFLLLNPERFVNVVLRLFAEPQRPRVQRLLNQASSAVFGYVSGNLVISFICGVLTLIVLLLLRMPYPVALALLVAVLDLVPLVGATLGGALLVIVGFFVSPLTALILLVYVLVYQQVEGSILQPMVYSRAVQLDPLLIFIAVLAGGLLFGIPGALLAIPVAEIIRIVVTDFVAHRSRYAQEEAALSAEQGETEPAVSSPSPQPPS
jgi:predicted PurR-regulated permease PerM